MKINKIVVLSIIILFFGTILTTQVQPTNQRTYEKDDYIPGEIILGLKKDFDINNLNPGNKDPFLGKKIIDINKKINFIVLEVETGMEDYYLERYTSFSKVSYAEKNIIMKRDDFIPNDSAWDRQWGPQNIKCPYSWDKGFGSKNVVVAILDGGVDYNHPDLDNNMWENENGYHGYDFVDSDNYPMDLDGHGTHCAGVAAAEINNNLGIAGISQVSIMAVRVMDIDGSSAGISEIANGIIYAADNGANVISMSFGCSTPIYTIRNATNYAWETGVILVASAGNDNSDWPHYPSSYSNVISVAATDQYDEKAFFSNYGSSVDIAAPGQDIYSTYLDGGYKFLSGTSMSCPHVAGVAALLKSQNPSWTNQQIKQKMFDTADKVGFEGNYWKHGKVDASIDEGDTQVFPNVFVEIEKITNIGGGLDGIDADGNPEWFYEVIVEHEKKESVTNFNFKDNPNKVSGDYYSYYIEEYESEISSSNTWNVKNGIHTFECYSPIVTVKIKLMEDDFIFDWFSDIADISSRNNPGGDFEIGYDERGRVFNCKYDLTTHSLVESESDRYEEDGELFFTKGSWDGSTGMETVDWKQDDAQLFFKISDDYNEPIVDAGGPYNARVEDTVTLDASVQGGFSPFQYFWDLNYDGIFEKQGKDVLFYCSESGEFKIKLKVTDSFGFSVFNETKIVVSENNAPDKPIISGPTQGNFGENYTYVVSSEDFDGDDVQYFVDWGDGRKSSWSEFVSSGESLEFNHSWDEKDTYYVKAKARDSFGKSSEWSEIEVSMPKSKIITSRDHFEYGSVYRIFYRFNNFLNKILSSF